MKRFLPLILFFCLLPLYAFEVAYPPLMNNGTIFINTGVGFLGIHTDKKQENITVPMLTVSMDAAIPVAGLPFTLGLITGYFSEDYSVGVGDMNDIHFDFIPIGARIGFHVDFDVPNLNTYAMLTLGAVIGLNDIENQYRFWFGFGIGGRYFFHPNIGAFLELGFDSEQAIAAGVCFKF